MKKFLLVFLLALFAVPYVFATSMVKITRITDTIHIKLPNGEMMPYKSIDELPELVYGAKILASGGTAEVKLFNTVNITLEKNQGILLLKNPITRALEISKLETRSKNPNIKAWLAGYASATFGADSKVTFLERYPSIFFGVKKGEAIVNGIEGRVYTLTIGEQYEAKQNIVGD